MARRWAQIVAVCLVLWWAAAPGGLAAAAPASGAGDVVGFNDIQVPAGTVVKNVVVMGANATIAGTVTDEVVVINGDVTLLPTAVIHDRVVVIGGDVHAAEGADFGKGLVRIGPEFASVGGLAVAGMALLLWWLLKMALLVALVLVPLLLVWLWPAGAAEMSRLVEASPGRCLAAGLLCGVAVLVVMLLLFISLIGIPLAIMFGLVALLAAAAGMGGVSLAVGRRLPINAPAGKTTLHTAAYGAVLLALAASVPLAGFLAAAVFLTIALGTFALKIFTMSGSAK